MVLDTFITQPLVSVLMNEPIQIEDDYYMVTIDLKEDNIYGIRSGEPVMAYIYGYDYYDSYGYPAGAILKDLSIVEKMEPNSSINNELDGNISMTIRDIGDNNELAGLAYVGLIPDDSKNYDIEISEDFEAGDSEVDIDLKVRDQLRDAKAVVYAIDKAGNVYTEEFVHKATSVKTEVTIDGVTIKDIYPSPVINDANIIIESEKFINTQMQVCDLLGNSILTKSINLSNGQNEFQIDLSDISSGTYFVKINVNGRILTEKIVK
jgi:hypothetical protein